MRNYGVENKEVNPNSFTVGFWTGASVTALAGGLFTIIGLWLIGAFW